jgi:protein tyrosine phosphatase (PTP) superfamily phosphohydrolase (DUF442 family)
MPRMRTTLLAALVLSAPLLAAPEPAPSDAPAPAHALHNVQRIGQGLISSAAPEGDAAFDEIAALGVRTIISVDGAPPDLERAKARGIRYVHIPVTYAEITPEQRLQLARAVRDLPGPILIHCHHGKHRGPAAAAAVAVALGQATNDEAIDFMKLAGTAPNYEGLYACVAQAAPATPDELDAAPADFPELHTPEGIVAAMVELDHVYELLQDVRAAGWKTPEDHPDLVPAAEAGRLVDLLRSTEHDPSTAEKGADYLALLHAAIARASELEEAIVQGAPRDALEPRWKLVAQSCKDCHKLWRDTPDR